MPILKKFVPLEYPECFALTGKVAVITGGASGIGFATATAFAQAGAKVILIDVNKEGLHSAKSTLLGRGIKSHVIMADVSDPIDVSRSFSEINNDFGSIDILVNCAGITIRKPAITLSIKDWRTVVDVNMTGSFLTAQAAAKIMCEKNINGVIIHTASIMGFSGGGIYPNISYQTTKGAIVNMTRAMAIEWADKKIRVNAVAPTYVRTPLIDSLINSPKVTKKIKDMTPLKRIAEPEEIASGIIFLASPGASMITGHTLVIDGGFLAQ